MHVCRKMAVTMNTAFPYGILSKLFKVQPFRIRDGRDDPHVRISLFAWFNFFNLFFQVNTRRARAIERDEFRIDNVY